MTKYSSLNSTRFKKGETQGPYGALMAICDEEPGFFEIDAESGGPMGTCAYSKLIRLGRASQSLESAGAKDGLSTNYLYHLAQAEILAETAIGKMHPECLKSFVLFRKCELKISIATANNIVNKDEKNAYNTSYIRK